MNKLEIFSFAVGVGCLLYVIPKISTFYYILSAMGGGMVAMNVLTVLLRADERKKKQIKTLKEWDAVLSEF